MTSDPSESGTDHDHVVEVPDREAQIPIYCPGCEQKFPLHLDEKIGAAKCPNCGDWIELQRPGDRREQTGDDSTEQTTLIPDGGMTESGISRPDPEDDPFRCSICGQPLRTTKRVAGDDHCDGCLREYGVLHR